MGPLKCIQESTVKYDIRSYFWQSGSNLIHWRQSVLSSITSNCINLTTPLKTMSGYDLFPLRYVLRYANNESDGTRWRTVRQTIYHRTNKELLIDWRGGGRAHKWDTACREREGDRCGESEWCDATRRACICLVEWYGCVWETGWGLSAGHWVPDYNTVLSDTSGWSVRHQCCQFHAKLSAEPRIVFSGANCHSLIAT